MRHMRIRAMSLLLVCAMLLSLLPVTALADGEETVLDISNGSITIGESTYTQGTSTQDIPKDGLVITGTSTENTITVNPGEGETAAFTIKGLNLTTTTGASLIDVQSGTAALTLEGENTLTGGGMGFADKALISVPQGSTLIIDGTGSLKLNNGTASAAAHGAAIGGSAAEDAGTINITAGTITIEQYGPGAGIGGGGPDSSYCTGDSGDITISGGSVTITVTAVNNYGGGCGIGPGMNYSTTPYEAYDGILNSITISGGEVNVQTVSILKNGHVYYSGAAIGTGRIGKADSDESNIHITGTAKVTAIADSAAAIGGSCADATLTEPAGSVSIQIDGDAVVNACTVPQTSDALNLIYARAYNGAAIGQAHFGWLSYDICIEGNAKILAEGGLYGAGIGNSYGATQQATLDISIGGSADVTAYSIQYAAGIGSSFDGAQTTDSRTNITIKDNAVVVSEGGYGAAGIGGGPGDHSGNITIQDAAKVTAIGGASAGGYTSGAGIGAGSSVGNRGGKVAGTITITEGTTVIAYAEGYKFAIDTDVIDGNTCLLSVTDTVLNGRFSTTANPPTDDDNAPSPINILKDGEIDAELTLPDDYRSFAVTVSDDSGTIRVQNALNLYRYAYYTDDEGNKQINFPVYENTDGSDGYLMLTEDNLDWMPIVELTPADITIYMGGSGYDGVVDESGVIEESMENGLPEAGFYVTLPDDLNNELKTALGIEDENEPLDLSPYLTFRSGEKTWSLALYDGENTSAVTIDGIERYIYRLVAGDNQVPVRMQFTDADGNVQTSDQFELDEALYSEYTMSIYPGAVDQTTVYAEIDTEKIKDDGGNLDVISYTTYAASAGSGKLTIRGVTQYGGTTAVASEVTEAVTQITAVLPENTTYTINGSSVQVVNGTPALLVDSIVHTDESDQLLKERALSTLGLEASDNLQYDFRYLDLVDTSNGNTWIKASDFVTVYWPYPEGTDQNTQFYLVHFKGLDREMTVDDLAEQINTCNAVNVDVTNTEYGISFTTDSFSPFVLIWEDTSTGGGGTTYYTLTYESNGGTAYSAESYPSGATVQLTKSPIREGYTFTGWYADAALTQPITSITMTSNKTVYAGWEATGVPDWLNGEDHFAYVIGYDDGTVRPLDNITRSEVAAIFFRLLRDDVREEYLTESNPFADVTEEMWHNTAISTLAAMGIVEGRSSTCFDPDAPITRAEFAAICARFDTGTVSGDSSFPDIEGHWAKEEIQRAASLGWVLGMPDGTFCPDQPITRAEAMTLINRVLNRIPEDEDALLDGMITWPDNLPGTWYYLAVQEATNSHTYEITEQPYERWTELQEPFDWTQYQ